MYVFILHPSLVILSTDKVLVTAFQHAVVPPPMCTFQLQLPQAVNQVMFHADPWASRDLAIFDADNRISVYRYGLCFVYHVLRQAFPYPCGVCPKELVNVCVSEGNLTFASEWSGLKCTVEVQMCLVPPHLPPSLSLCVLSVTGRLAKHLRNAEWIVLWKCGTCGLQTLFYHCSPVCFCWGDS